MNKVCAVTYYANGMAHTTDRLTLHEIRSDYLMPR